MLDKRICVQVDDKFIEAKMTEIRFANGLLHAEFCIWNTMINTYPGDAEIVASKKTPQGGTYLLKFSEQTYSILILDKSHAYITVESKSLEEIAQVIKETKELLPQPSPPAEKQIVPLSFWTLGTNGPISRTRMLEVPRWEEIGSNYAERAKNLVGYMLSDKFIPSSGGQLILWHGIPGTGKTWAIRSWLWEWRERAMFHYITDPEAFFGNSDYMMQVLFDLSGVEDLFGIEVEDSIEVAAEALKESKAEVRQKWNILVLEDTGELVVADAKNRTGQGLSRMLNLVDGLIGQGLKVLVLITTNEEVKTLHPAISRPGRCALEVKFEALSATEADQWLEERGHGSSDNSKTLAELYAEIEDQVNKSISEPVGFN